MYFKLILSGLKKNFFTNLLLFVFIFASTLLFSSALGLITELSSSVNAVMEKAQTPDFMQMHSGSIDYNRLESFVKENNNIKSFQVSPMLNINGNDIFFGDESLSGSVMDNGFCVQNKLFDFLLDEDGKIIGVETETLKDGEIYIPLNYWKKFSVSKNDKMTVCGKTFTVKGFLRDSQMNSDMASSKRFLITKADYENLRNGENGNTDGSEEYLIEFKGNAEIENAYIEAGLENNGPTITRSLFFMINALSDGILIALIILISILLVFVSFLCIRFTLLATLEDDYKEIGVMKAVGFYHKEISSMYLSKYMALDFLGCLLGFGFSFLFKQFLIREINLYVADNSNFVSSLLLALGAAIILFFCILLYVSHVLKGIKKVSAAKAVREDKNVEMEASGKSIRLESLICKSPFGVNLFLGIQDVLKRKKMFVTLFVVFILAVFIIIVPQNIYQTIKDSSFVNYMGISDCNARIDLQQLPDIDEKANEISKWLENDDDVEFFNMYTTRSYKIAINFDLAIQANGSGVNTADSVDTADSANALDIASAGDLENLKIESGDYSNNTIKYISGNEPKTQDDLALSYICANEFGKKVGDEVVLFESSAQTENPVQSESSVQSRIMKVCGIYSDVTNGGITAKMLEPETETDRLPPVMWYIFCIQYKDGEDVAQKGAQFKSTFSFGKFTQVEGYIRQTVGSTIDTINIASKISILIAILIAVLISSLFIKLITAKDDYSISILHSLGFSKNDIRIQYICRIVFTLFLGVIIGTLAANTLGVSVAGMFLSNLGIASFHFVIKPLLVYVLLPFVLLIAVCASSIVSIRIKSEHV